MVEHIDIYGHREVLQLVLHTHLPPKAGGAGGGSPRTRPLAAHPVLASACCGLRPFARSIRVWILAWNFWSARNSWIGEMTGAWATDP